MERFKGRFVAQIIIDIDFIDDGATDAVPFEEARERVVGGEFREAIEGLLKEEIVYDGSGMTLTVEQQYADLYKVEEATP